MNGVRDLLVAGAKNILVFNQAPIQAFSYISILNQPTVFIALTILSNYLIASSLEVIQQNYPNASIYMFDIHAVITKILSNDSTVTFANTVSQCWGNFNLTTVTILCSDPSKYVFLDNFHVTTGVHQIISDAIRPFLSYTFNRDTPSCYIGSF